MSAREPEDGQQAKNEGTSRHVAGLSWPLITGLAAFCVAAFASGIFNDPDTYWHLATYRWIVEHLAVPTADPFSFTMSGAPWTAHEWGSELLMGLSFDVFGWSGVQLLIAAAFGLTVAYLTRFVMPSMEPIHALLIVCISVALLLGHLLARPHVLAWPVMALWVGTLARAAEERRAPTFWLLGLLVIWINLHGSFTLGLGFAGAFAIDALLRERDYAGQRAAMLRWTPFMLGVLACILVNPQGFGAITYAIDVMSMKDTLDVVDEWKSADFHEFQALLLWLFPVLLLAFRGRLQLPIWRAVMVVGLLYLALKHQRYHSLVGLLAPLLMAGPLGQGLLAPAPSDGKQAAALDAIFTRLKRPARRTTTLLAISVVLALAIGLHSRGPAAPASENTPIAALDSMQALGVSGPVLNAYSFGGYLIYRGIPVFIDGRSDMYGDAFVRRWASAINLSRQGALEETLQDHAIAWTLLHPSTPAAQLLDRLPGWRRAYEDSIAVVHVREASAP